MGGGELKSLQQPRLIGARNDVGRRGRKIRGQARAPVGRQVQRVPAGGEPAAGRKRGHVRGKKRWESVRHRDMAGKKDPAREGGYTCSPSKCEKARVTKGAKGMFLERTNQKPTCKGDAKKGKEWAQDGAGGTKRGQSPGRKRKGRGNKVAFQRKERGEQKKGANS